MLLASLRRSPVRLALQRLKLAPMSTLADDFARKVALGKTLPPLTDNAAKLEMYALYKQANVGKVNKPRPGMLDFVGRAMWDAWNKLGDMSQEEAMTKYIAIIDDMAAKNGAGASVEAVESDTDDLLVDISESGLLTLTLNRPAKYNALNHGMYDGITKALQTSASQERVKAVLLKSTGAMFTSGNDLTMFTSNPQGLTLEQLADAGAVILENFVDAFLTYPKPIVAAVQGPAVGIGATLLALCDFVYVSETTTLHTPFTSLGQSPEACSSALFPRIMGPARANAMLLLGEKFAAQDAVSSGLATECFGVAEFDKKVQEKVDLLLSRYPQSMIKSKALIRTPAVISELQAINRAECETLKKLWLGPECMDAILKFQSRKK